MALTNKHTPPEFTALEMADAVGAAADWIPEDWPLREAVRAATKTLRRMAGIRAELANLRALRKTVGKWADIYHRWRLTLEDEDGERNAKAWDAVRRQVKNDCVEAGVPFYLKQIQEVGKLVRKPVLDGQQWLETPWDDLRAGDVSNSAPEIDTSGERVEAVDMRPTRITVSRITQKTGEGEGK